MNNTDLIRKWNSHKGIILDTIEEFDVLECQTCGFRHIVPIPSQEE